MSDCPIGRADIQKSIEPIKRRGLQSFLVRAILKRSSSDSAVPKKNMVACRCKKKGVAMVPGVFAIEDIEIVFLRILWGQSVVIGHRRAGRK